MTKKRADDRLVDYLRSAITDGSAGLSDAPALVKRVIEEAAWKERYVPQIKETIVFTTFREFVEAVPPEGLGTTLKTLRRLCADEKAVLDLIEQTERQPGRGGDRRSRNFKNNLESNSKNNNITFEKSARGNSLGYSLRRLREHRADLHRKVLSGEISAHQAMIQAGFRKKSFQIPQDLVRAGKIIKRRFTRTEIARLIKLLQQEE